MRPFADLGELRKTFSEPTVQSILAAYAQADLQILVGALQATVDEIATLSASVSALSYEVANLRSENASLRAMQATGAHDVRQRVETLERRVA